MIARENGCSVPRCTLRVTTLPFGPRIRSRAPSTVRPSSDTPSVASTRSPVLRPALAAGEPAIGATMTSRHAGPSVAQPCVPSAACVAISAPMPSNSPLIPWRESWYSLEVRYEEYGSPSASIMPRMAPWTMASRSTSPPAYRSLIVWYVSQNGRNAASSLTGVPGSRAVWRPIVYPDMNSAPPASSATTTIAIGRIGQDRPGGGGRTAKVSGTSRRSAGSMSVGCMTGRACLGRRWVTDQE